jgi:outer membrane lipoprotein-sorting protein
MNLPVRQQPWLLLLALVALLPLGGCFFRTHAPETRNIAGNIKESSLAELVERINGEAQKIKTMNATVDIAASAGGQKKGKVTDYQEIRGYILVRKPKSIRLIGLLPVVRTKAFDMVSDGQVFKVSIPPKSRFIIGRDDVPPVTKTQSLENMRPQFIFDALLLQEIDPQNEIAVLENTYEMATDPKANKKTLEMPSYTVNVVRRLPEGGWYLSRKIVFTRDDLQPHRQIVYDKAGNVATDAHYDNFKPFDNLLFPSLITITRPQEEYTVQLGIVKVKLNETIRDDQFALAQPPGAQVVRLDQPQTNPAPASGTPPGAPHGPGEQK